MREGAWFKSSRSAAVSNCVEVFSDGDTVRIRDSKQRGTGPVLSFDADTWSGFVADVKGGKFDR